MHPQHFMCRVSLKAPMERAKGQAAKFKVRKSWVSCHLQNLILFYFGDSRQELAWLLRISQLHFLASWLYESWMNMVSAFAGAVANCLLIAAGHKFRLGKNPLRDTRFDLKIYRYSVSTVSIKVNQFSLFNQIHLCWWWTTILRVKKNTRSLRALHGKLIRITKICTRWWILRLLCNKLSYPIELWG